MTRVRDVIRLFQLSRLNVLVWSNSIAMHDRVLACGVIRYYQPYMTNEVHHFRAIVVSTGRLARCLIVLRVQDD